MNVEKSDLIGMTDAVKMILDADVENLIVDEIISGGKITKILKLQCL